MHDDSSITTFLFTDIEGSTRLWEQQPERMRTALAHHDAVVRSTVQAHRGEVVKMTGDGVHAAFADPMDAVQATMQLQLQVLAAQASHGVPLRVRCGLHAGASERRDNDFYGSEVNRAARVMGAAHGGQMLLSQAVAQRVRDRLPDGVTLRDLGSVRLRDLASSERLYQLVHPGLRAEFPALRSLEATPNNLPHALSSFIGRERERTATCKLLEAARLVTLLGVGGLGKSRLALQVAADVMDDYPDGIWWVELAPLADARRVAQAAAVAMRVVPEPGLALEETLERHVSDRRLLLILDNCEHVIEAAASLARGLLAAGAGVRILATSREPLRLGGESGFPIPPLPVPGPREAVESVAVVQYDSVRLFVERACAAQPEFTLTPENAPLVAAICHRLDGMPLAIELAGARVRSLSVQQIAARLKDRFRLLTSGDPTALPRQRTLRALIDWSHDLLAEDERALFRRLSVFAGGWALESAEDVCAGGAVERENVLELLSSLVEKSLAARDAQTGRYRFLVTVREYAREQLEARQETAELRGRHFLHFARLADEARSNLVGPQQPAWLARLDVELENLLSAHEWAHAQADLAVAGLGLAGALKHYWIGRGLLELGLRVTLEALQRDAASQRASPRSRTLFHAGQLLYLMGRFADARRSLEECLAIAREIGDANVSGAVLQPLGMAALGEGDFATARFYLEEALALAQARGERRGLAAAMTALAQFYRVEGSRGKARALNEHALAIARELGDRDSEAIVQLNRAIVLIEDGDCAPAREALREAVEAAAALGSARLDQSVLEVCAGLATALGQWKLAARFFGAGEACARETALRREPVDEAFLAPRSARARESLPPAAFEEAERAGRALARAAALEEARAWLQAARLEEPLTDR